MPRARNVSSPNFKFLLKVDPHKNRLSIFTDPPGPRPVWEFDDDIGFDECLITDDGETVVMALTIKGPSERRRDGACLRFRDRKGEFKRYLTIDLVKDPAARSHWMNERSPLAPGTPGERGRG